MNSIIIRNIQSLYFHIKDNYIICCLILVVFLLFTQIFFGFKQKIIDSKLEAQMRNKRDKYKSNRVKETQQQIQRDLNDSRLNLYIISSSPLRFSCCVQCFNHKMGKIPTARLVLLSKCDESSKRQLGERERKTKKAYKTKWENSK